MLDVALPDPFESEFARGIYDAKYRGDDRGWHDTAVRVARSVMDAVDMAGAPETAQLIDLIYERKFIPGGRYLYAAGRDLHQVQNCALYRCDDTREGWADLFRKTSMSLMTGAGVGVDYSFVRPMGWPIYRTGGTASGPLSPARIVNETGRNVMQGGARRSAIWAGLYWWHPDIFDFIRVKDWSQEVREAKEVDFNYPADFDYTNVSVALDRAFFDAKDGYDIGPFLREYAPDWFTDEMYDRAPDGGPWQAWADRVYDETVEHMVTTAEPGFSVNYDNPRESLRNACTEITSEDDSDICNLGSLNLSRFDDIHEFVEATQLGTLFLLAGTVYSHLPHDEVYETREKNRRLGLGLMGVHEWLLVRGKPYGPDPMLGNWLERWEQVSNLAAWSWADTFNISRPIKVRAIAPNGTIGILAETTTSAEPIFAAAYKRRVKTANARRDIIEFEYVVDPTAARLVAQGVDPKLIEDAYTLSYDVERRIAMQAWLQQFVDHGISSTVNLPAVDAQNFTPQEFGEILWDYLPQLRGITCYPDGSRGGQPLTAVPIEYALAQGVGVRFEENEERCVGGACGI